MADRQGKADELGEQERRIAQEGHDERAGMDSKEREGSAEKSKARMKSFEKEQEQVSKSAHANLVESGSIVIPNGPRLGNKVIQVSNLNHSFDDGEKKIFSDVSFTVPNGATVGIIGGTGWENRHCSQ